MNTEIKPNTFLIGVQKAATSSLYNWLSQHDEICAPPSLKDIPFFADDRLFSKGFGIFNQVYPKYYNGQKVIIQGNVNYIYFEKALKRIKDYSPNAKFILILRNPVDRAISAYNFSVRRGMENLEIEKAFEREEEVLSAGRFQELSDHTYKSHGLYFEQLKTFKKYFSVEQLAIVFFEDLKESKENELGKIFKFLEVSTDFQPKLNYLNETGQPRNSFINRLIYKESKFKEFIMRVFVNKLFSFDTKVKAKLLLGRIMTKKRKDQIKLEVPDSLNVKLKEYYLKDIEKLEKELNIDLAHWK